MCVCVCVCVGGGGGGGGHCGGIWWVSNWLTLFTQPYSSWMLHLHWCNHLAPTPIHSPLPHAYPKPHPHRTQTCLIRIRIRNRLFSECTGNTLIIWSHTSMLIVSPRNLTGNSAELLPWCPSNLRAMGKILSSTLAARNPTKSREGTTARPAEKGPDVLRVC